MADTQVTQKLGNNALQTPVLFRAEGSAASDAGGFITMLQALDITLTSATQPQPSAAEPPINRAAPKPRADKKADDDAPEPSSAGDLATEESPQPRHQTDARAAGKAPHETAPDSHQTQDKTAPQAGAPDATDTKLAAPDSMMEDAVLVETPSEPKREDKATSAIVNLLAGLMAQTPKTAATQKASPEPGSSVVATDGAAVTSPAAAPAVTTDGATAALEASANPNPTTATSTDKAALTPKLAAPATSAHQAMNDGQPQANDNNPLRQFNPATPETTKTEQRHTAENTAALTDKIGTTAASASTMPSLTPLITAATTATKPAETPQQLQAKLEANSVRGVEGSVRLLNSYSNTAHLTAARSAQTATLRAPEIVEQVAVKLNHQAKTGLDTMTIQLRPTDLGRIDVKLNFHDGSVTGMIIADNQATLDLLVKDQRALERALQESGLRTDSGSLSFQLRDQSGQQAAQQERGSKRGGWQDAAFDIGSDAALVADSAGDGVISADRINLKV